MSDDLERRLRDALRSERLPEAPARLRGYLPSLEGDEWPVLAPVRPSRSRFWLLVAPAAAVLVGALVMSGGSPKVAPTPTPSSSASDGATRMFDAPGISFEYPREWDDQTDALQFIPPLGERYVGLFGDGFTNCPVTYDDAAPTPIPGSCDQGDPDSPGEMTFSISESLRQYPWALSKATATTAAGYPMVEPDVGPYSQDNSAIWQLLAPDGGVYLFMVRAPVSELGARVEQVRALLATVRLSVWEAEPEVVDGEVHVDTGQGFSFDYPGDWSVYYERDVSMVDYGVITVSSVPLEPPCVGDECRWFTQPEDSTVMEFRIGSGPGPTDWSGAPLVIGGQPAFRSDWDAAQMGVDAGHSWRVRLLDSESSLSVSASLRGDDLTHLRQDMMTLLSTITISPPGETP